MARSIVSMVDVEHSLRDALWLSTAPVGPLPADDLTRQHRAEQFWQQGEEWMQQYQMDKQLDLIQSGVASLQEFVLLNWAGKRSIDDAVHVPLTEDEEKWLVQDGESLHVATKRPDLLYWARRVLASASHVWKQNWVINWWQFRTCMILQQVITETSEKLHKEAEDLISIVAQVTDIPKSGQVLWALERAQFHGLYFEVEKVERCVLEAAAVSGFQVTETGALGKRTKFQQADLAQFALDISGAELTTVEVGAECPAPALPLDLRLDDEVRLNKIWFSESRPKTSVSRLQQCLLLACFTLKQKSQPKDALANEEVMPYLEAVLSTGRSSWASRMSALLCRSRLEAHDRRAVERSLMQVQSLVDHTSDPASFSQQRLDLIFASRLPPSWEVERDLCALLQSLGSIKSALDIALRLKLWEDVIQCYHFLKLRHKAAEVIREQLAEKETVLLLCMLGDATDELEHYERALELSSGRSARAHRSLGVHYYFRKDYAAAVTHFGKSLELNSFQMSTLLRLGYAAMEVQQWEVAADAYRKYCAYVSDNFEAWNNLCNAYVKLGQKSRAWKVLQEAVKCDYDNWKIWDNIMVVSTDCAHFYEVFRAYHRILDLKEKHVDTEVLGIIVHAITSEGVEDNQGQNCRRYLELALKLLGRLTSQVTNNGEVWHFYSQLKHFQADQLTNDDPDLADLYVTACQYRQKSVTSLTNNPGWDKDAEQAKAALEAGNSLALDLFSAPSSVAPARYLSLMSSAKMSLRNIFVLVTKSQTSVQTGTIVEPLANLVADLEKNLDQLGDKMAPLQASK